MEKRADIRLFELARGSISRFKCHPKLDVTLIWSADGQRFPVNTIDGEAARVPLTVVVNWAAGLGK